MKPYLIKVEYETEIQADNPDHAKEVFFDEIDNFEDCLGEFVERNMVINELTGKESSW